MAEQLGQAAAATVDAAAVRVAYCKHLLNSMTLLSGASLGVVGMAMYARRGALMNHSSRPSCWTLFEPHASGASYLSPSPYYVLPRYLLPHSLPRSCTALLPYPLTASLPHYLATSLPRYLATSLPHYLATSLRTYYLGASYTLLVRALSHISPGDEITINYVDLAKPC